MNWRWISAVAVLAALMIGLGIFSGRNPVSDGVTELPVRPAYYLKDAIITQTEPSGAPSLRLVASRIEQEPEDDSILLHSVRVDYLKVPDKKWFLSAQRGLVPPDSRLIRFMGDVELRPTDGPSTSVLKTEEITIDSDRNIAYTTTSPVRIRFGRYSMNVRRFEADLTNEKVKMETVRGRSDAG